MSKWARLLILTLAVATWVFLFICPRGAKAPRELAGPSGEFIETGGLELHVQTAGHGEPAFVLLHGFGASTFSWRHVKDPISEMGYVMAFDRPGFGLTPRPLQPRRGQPDPYGHQFGVILLNSLVDDLRADRVVLVAHSAGSRIAVDLVLAQPDKVEALILVAPVLGQESLTPVSPWLGSPLIRALGPYLLRPLAYLLPLYLDRAWHDEKGMPAEGKAVYTLPLKVVRWDLGLWGVIAAARPGEDLDLSDLSLPVMIVAGAQDTITSPSDARALAGEIDGARLVIIDQCGHLPHEERPVEFLDAVRSFVAGLPGR